VGEGAPPPDARLVDGGKGEGFVERHWVRPEVSGFRIGFGMACEQAGMRGVECARRGAVSLFLNRTTEREGRP
jgi:hypothetical protein